ncbi:SufD family Fe-S cluster assembly protein [Enterobacteriaceae endosymbiont of Donacia cincticornis]|uniref:SufD family Fe-S cluster assembly protein n=1 Tax=Enterobacteriaceae endosymbiont of Donacia cincticornis TaxID=2675773 RepID=UPI001456A57C|nr:SufD family Fe-S cluster assembly protein [Enterobacteriaceae endosymbiont of Donacia cincticornis]
MKNNIYNKLKNLYKLNKKYFYYKKTKNDLYKLKNFLKKELLRDNQKLLFKYLNNNLLINSKSLPINNNKLFKSLFPIDAIILFFINGKIDKNLSNINNKYYNIHINLYNDIHYSNFFKKDIYHYLSESFTKENVIININNIKKIKFKKPLYIVYFNDKNKKNEIAIFNYRNFIYIKNTFSTIIEHHINTDKSYINNIYNTFIIDNNSKLEHYTFITNYNNNNNNNFCSISNEFILYDNVLYKKEDILMSNQYINQNNNFCFLGEKTKLIYNSLLFSKNSNIINVNNYLEHNKKNSCSVQLHKTITLDQSIINLIGLLKINKYAMKTNGQLNYSSLLLNKLSRVNIQPNLDILNDNVKCTHSVFTGRIDYNQIFFLKTRGISFKKAYSLLLMSFILDSLNEISNNIIKNEILKKISFYLSVENFINEF